MSSANIPGRTPLTPWQTAQVQQLDMQHGMHLRVLEGLKGQADVDQRSLATAITHAETAHMWAVRAICKPVF